MLMSPGVAIGEARRPGYNRASATATHQPSRRERRADAPQEGTVFVTGHFVPPHNVPGHSQSGHHGTSGLLAQKFSFPLRPTQKKKAGTRGASRYKERRYDTMQRSTHGGSSSLIVHKLADQ